ncbi:uncharacterized protein LOC120636650 [Pararge aegeria]|uniref:uncharacterized protein LOC120636650 n=1 Tax=Pararge aegeria TaxID=116150 RepID=UPI0019D1763E|nr:uncharacterized protein LOC120636650 [Pararge aegeria]
MLVPGCAKMQVERFLPLSIYHSSIIFKTGKECVGIPEDSKEAEPVLRHAVAVHRADRVQRSRSSPERRSGPQSQRERTRSPSTRATSVSLEEAIPSSMFYNYSSIAPGAVAFYSPGPPSAPMYLVFLPTNPMTSIDGAKKFQPTKQQPIAKVTKSKKSRKIVRHVIQVLLRGVYKAVTIRAQPPEAAPVVESTLAEDSSPKKPNPTYHSVSSQTKPKSPIIRQAAVLADADGLSISSEERCVEYEESCEWTGNFRALRDSHVRLVLRQLQQLRDIERLNRTLLRAHITLPQSQTVNVTHLASCVPQSNE